MLVRITSVFMEQHNIAMSNIPRDGTALPTPI